MHIHVQMLLSTIDDGLLFCSAAINYLFPFFSPLTISATHKNNNHHKKMSVRAPLRVIQQIGSHVAFAVGNKHTQGPKGSSLHTSSEISPALVVFFFFDLD